jgi:hypothetical protein
MKHATFALNATSSLVCLMLAHDAEARSLRADDNTNNGWDTCSASNTCASLAAGLTFNPLGSDPSAAPSPTSIVGGTSVFAVPPDGFDAQSPCGMGGNSTVVCTGPDTPSWSTPVPGVSFTYSSGATQAQVMFFDLSQGSGSTEQVFGPNPSLVSDSANPDDPLIGDPVALGSAAGKTAWEIEFNYSGPTSSSASLDFGGNTYTASAALLSNSNNLNEFVYYDGTLYAPTGWQETPDAVRAPELDATSVISALSLLFGSIAVLRGRRQMNIA